MKKILWMPIALLLILTGCVGKIDAFDYFDYEIKGVDGAGRLVGSYDYDGLADVYGERMKNKDLKELLHVYDYVNLEYLTEIENLSNGDVVEVEISVDGSKVKGVKGGKQKIKISGLQETKELTEKDILENVTFEFTGASGFGGFDIDYDALDYPYDRLSFVFEDLYSLENGTLTKVEVETRSGEDYIYADDQEDVYIIKDKVIEVPVSGLVEAPDDIKDIDNFKDVKLVFTEKARALVADDSEIVGYYFRKGVPEDSSLDGSAGWAGRGHSYAQYVILFESKNFYSNKPVYTLVLSGDYLLGKEENSNNLKKAQEATRYSYGTDHSKKAVITMLESEGFKQVK